MKIKEMIKTVTVLALAAGLAACGGKKTEQVLEPLPDIKKPAETAPAETSAAEVAGDMIVGGWSINQDETAIENYPEVLEAFEKATKDLTGYSYEPFALLATQLVSGTNYCILCRGHVVIPDPAQEIVLVYLYEDLAGNAEIIGRKNVFKGQTALGGYRGNTGSLSVEDNEEVKAAFEGALMNLTGASYEPVAYLGDQAVKGTNYVVLSRVRAVAPNAQGKFAYVTVYQNVDEPAKFKDVTDVVFGEYDE